MVTCKEVFIYFLCLPDCFITLTFFFFLSIIWTHGFLYSQCFSINYSHCSFDAKIDPNLANRFLCQAGSSVSIQKEFFEINIIGWKVVFLCDFNLHISDQWWKWSSFIFYQPFVLYFFLWGLPIHIFLSFFFFFGKSVFTPIIKSHPYKWNVFSTYCQSLPASTSLCLNFFFWSSLALECVLK